MSAENLRAAERESEDSTSIPENQDRRDRLEWFIHFVVSVIVGDWIQYDEHRNKYYIEIDNRSQNRHYIKHDETNNQHYIEIDTSQNRRDLPCGAPLLCVLFFYAILLVLFAIVTFLTLFLFATTSSTNTNPGTFCLPTGGNSAERIRNCTMQEDDMICYQLELNFVTAAGVIGGLFTIIHFFTSLNYKVIKYYCDERNERHVCVVILYIIFLVFLVALFLGFCIVGVIVPLKNVFDTIVFIIQYVGVIFAILLGGCIPVICVQFGE